MVRKLTLYFACSAAVALYGGAASAQVEDDVTITTRIVDQVDDNRFFTRVGGTAVATTDYAGLTPGQSYTLASQLVVGDTGEPHGDAVFTTFTPAAPTGTETVQLPIEPNRTDSNITYVLMQTLYDGALTAADAATATVLAEQTDIATIDQTIEVHAIQAISVGAVDAADGDHAVPGDGGTIVASVDHVNLVAGYSYTIGGQLLTPSGQATGVYANIPLPARRQGRVHDVGVRRADGVRGQRLVPAVGLYHQNRVAINANGGIDWLPDAPQPVMIASDPDLHDPSKTIEIGTPFDADPATAPTTSGPLAPDPTLAPPSSEGSDDSRPLLWFGGGIAAGAAITGTGVWFRKRTLG